MLRVPEIPLNVARAARLAELRARLDATLADALGPARDCALLDFPCYANVGDSALWLGGSAWLRARGVRVRYVASYADYDTAALRRRLPPGGTILLSGGGNLGTLYPRHQALRERVLRECRDYRVVQLPQSIHFGDDAPRAAFARLVREHPSFVLLVRDAPSLALARDALGADARLCPDAAIWLAGRLSAPPPSCDAIVLARADAEATGALHEALAALPPTASIGRSDWPQRAGGLRLRVASSAVRRLAGTAWPLDAMRRVAVDAVARERLRDGIALLARGRCVVTDRLHGMILALLIGRRCIALDNRTGKLAAFHDAWLRELPGCTLAADAAEALAALRAGVVDAATARGD